MAHAGTLDGGPRFRIPRIKIEVKFEVRRHGGGGPEPDDDRPGFWRRLVQAIRAYLR
ncbi:hypothetical protein [Roseomonas sp. USHLN139]|uniref:hypothetical protein n=1 Tax=Roseomonas sp. USHLN139 TaxID=3081298 RepID=UPI003B0120F2